MSGTLRTNELRYRGKGIYRPAEIRLDAQNFSATSVIFNLDGSYPVYVVRFVNTVFASNDGVFEMETSTDNGVSWDSTSGDYSTIAQSRDGAGNSLYDEADDRLIFNDSSEGIGNDGARDGLRLEMLIFNANEAGAYTGFVGAGSYHSTVANGDRPVLCQFGGMRFTTSDITNLRFQMPASVMTGRGFLYGIKEY